MMAVFVLQYSSVSVKRSMREESVSNKKGLCDLSGTLVETYSPRSTRSSLLGYKALDLSTPSFFPRRARSR